MGVAAIVIPIFFVVFFGVGSIMVVTALKQGKKHQQQQSKTAESYRTHSSTSTSNGKTAMTDEQRRRLDYLREQYKNSDEDKHELHQKDAHEHGHVGDEEHYEEIVGSLGEVNDEGCDSLSGVRFIAHDLAYDGGEEGEHDYTELAKAMVLGEIFNTPRFKSPHTHRK